VAAGRQASRKLFGERLKSAVARRNASRAQHGDFHFPGTKGCLTAIFFRKSTFIRTRLC
jgi:hypothetical protein